MWPSFACIRSILSATIKYMLVYKLYSYTYLSLSLSIYIYTNLLLLIIFDFSCGSQAGASYVSAKLVSGIDTQGAAPGVLAEHDIFLYNFYLYVYYYDIFLYIYIYISIYIYFFFNFFVLFNFMFLIFAIPVGVLNVLTVFSK